jgi:ribosomal protein S18 acetylase RimI-like enzyme
MSIGVLEEFRRKSFGSLFIEFIKKNYKSNITLYVQISNENAINFYKKNNFIIEKKITNYYKTLEVKDAYLMKFKLN